MNGINSLWQKPRNNTQNLRTFGPLSLLYCRRFVNYSKHKQQGYTDGRRPGSSWSSANSSRGALCGTGCAVPFFFFATSGIPSVGHISPMYTCARIEMGKKKKKNPQNRNEKKIQVRFEYAGCSASQSNHNCG